MVTKAVIVSTQGGVVKSGEHFPALFLATPKAQKRFWEFFTANIRNVYTRKGYLKAVCRFSDWCRARKLELDQGAAGSRGGLHRASRR